jgi:hypothetical protein
MGSERVCIKDMNIHIQGYNHTYTYLHMCCDQGYTPRSFDVNLSRAGDLRRIYTYAHLHTNMHMRIAKCTYINLHTHKHIHIQGYT